MSLLTTAILPQIQSNAPPVRGGIFYNPATALIALGIAYQCHSYFLGKHIDKISERQATSQKCLTVYNTALQGRDPNKIDSKEHCRIIRASFKGCIDLLSKKIYQYNCNPFPENLSPL